MPHCADDVGVIEGDGDGFGVGDDVGAAVGEGVGCAVGSDEGEADAPADGDVVAGGRIGATASPETVLAWHATVTKVAKAKRPRPMRKNGRAHTRFPNVIIDVPSRCHSKELSERTHP